MEERRQRSDDIESRTRKRLERCVVVQIKGGGMEVPIYTTALHLSDNGMAYEPSLQTLDQGLLA